MFQERIMLTVNDIYNKEFKLDTRGYRPQEVDKYLDVIMRDYEEFISIIIISYIITYSTKYRTSRFIS